MSKCISCIRISLQNYHHLKFGYDSFSIKDLVLEMSSL